MNGPQKPGSPAIDFPSLFPETGCVPIVALGGSAGAYAEFKEFFSHIPNDTGAAFVVIQHLSPLHGSILPELLAQTTQMRVAPVRDSTPAEANCVYVIHPGTNLEIRQGILRVSEREEQPSHNNPIDVFFRSLAMEEGSRVISVLFSGAGSDGVAGMQAIRMTGGLALAQAPETAQFETMPQGAVDAGAVDFVLSPADIPGMVLKHLRQPLVQVEEASQEEPTNATSPHVPEILSLVFARTGHDFTAYKKGSIGRRIHRRMTLLKASSGDAYCEILRQNPLEIDLLVKDLLINTTSFFRDPEVFDELIRKIIKPMLQIKAPDDFLRIWVPACASGEEAYSLAILFNEEIEASGKRCRLQIFATDIDGDALEYARHGLYPESVSKNISPHRLEKFFLRRDGSLQVSEVLRKSVVFALQNLMADPPFSKMDLVSCRNFLIYLEPQAQAKAHRVFAFSLNPGGCLLLGKSETICEQDALFHTVSRTSRIYQRLLNARPAILDNALAHGKKVISVPPGTVHEKVQPKLLGDAIRRALLSHFSASAVLIDKVGNVLQFFGETERFLALPDADPSFNIFDLAKGAIALRLQSALRRILHEGASAVHDEVVHDGANGQSLVRISVEQTETQDRYSPILAVIFEEVIPPTRISAPFPASQSDTARISELEHDLQASQRDLRSTIEDLQSANEQLRISNEEVLSSNEELQSTNEELGTSQEELQSVNEELTTVNNELQMKVQTLDSLHNDMVNLLNSTEIATLFLDSNLRIKYFTPATTQVLNLIATDIGRPVSHISLRIVNCNIEETARTVLKSGTVLEQNARDLDQKSYFVRFMPYRASNEFIDGVVITFDDVTKLLAAEAAQAANSAKTLFLANMSHEIRTPLNAILGFCELMKNDRLAPSERSEFLDIVLHNGSQLVSLIDDILDMSMVENGKVVINERPHSPLGLLEDVRHLLAPRAEAGRVELAIANEGNVPETVLTDAKKLTQILTNVIGNAIKFTPEGGQVLAKAAYREGILEFVVEDSGAGVPRDEQERIFEAFQRGSNERTRQVAGTGLGLALSRKLARLLGGDVKILESVVGRGTTFLVRVATTQAPPPLTRDEPDTNLNAQSLPLRGHKILVAENDASSRRLMKEMLSFLGAAVVVVEDGEQAIDAAMANKFDVVLMDHMMPRKDGLTATRQLRKQGYQGPIIAVSAQALVEQRKESMAAGCDGHLTKPVSMGALLAELEKHCR